MKKNLSISLLLLLFVFVFACKKKEAEVTPAASTVVVQDTTKKDTTKVFYAKLTFCVKTFNSTNGNLLAALFNSSSNYTNNVRFKSFTAKVMTDSLQFTFDSIPVGNYCMSCFHDANSNNVIDKNLFGAPTEGYGFSNNPGITFGAPPFNQIKFSVDSVANLKYNVALIYF